MNASWCYCYVAELALVVRACVYVSIYECMNLSAYVCCTYVHINPYVGLAYKHM